MNRSTLAILILAVSAIVGRYVGIVLIDIFFQHGMFGFFPVPEMKFSNPPGCDVAAASTCEVGWAQPLPPGFLYLRWLSIGGVMLGLVAVRSSYKLWSPAVIGVFAGLLSIYFTT